MAHVCPGCSFVQDKKTLFLYIISREQKEAAGNNPSFIGNYSMDGWSGHSGFYLFKCKECHGVTLDYPHGYRQEFVYLKCDGCGLELVLNPRKHREVYVREKLYIPGESSGRKKRKITLKSRERRQELEKVSDMGIIPLISPAEEPEKTFIQKILTFVGLKS